MKTNDCAIDFAELKLLSQAQIMGDSPLEIQLGDEDLVLELASSSDGVQWQEDQYIILDFMVEMTSKATIRLDFCHGDNVTSLSYSKLPNRRVKMALPLNELVSQRWFLPVQPGSFQGHVVGKPTHITQIDKVKIVLRKGRDFNKITFYSMYVSDAIPDLSVIGEPLVDHLGQWRDMEWEGKTSSEHELVQFLQQEYEAAQKNTGYLNDKWSKFGGYTGLKFEATGFFRSQHDGSRWWLVDPEGYAYFSNGICYGSRMGDFGMVDKMETLFEWLPEEGDHTYAEAWTTADQIDEFVKRNGKEAGKDRKLFNFGRANMIKAFGEKWREAWITINGSRLKQWGFNTIGVGVNNYNDENTIQFLSAVEIPFTWTLKGFPRTEDAIFRDMPDVFSPEYRANSQIFAEQLKPFVHNPYFVGYFINNEPEWVVAREVNPAERVLAHPKKLHSKVKLVEYLIGKYDGDIGTFNRAWNLNFENFENLFTPIEDADLLSEQANADLTVFRDLIIEQYSVVPSEELKKVDPVHLNLGMRYAYIAQEDLAGSAAFDAFSFNCYARSPEEKLNMVQNMISKPLIIGEWHIGGADKGLLSTAHFCAKNQEQRGKASVYYMQQAMANKACTGIHYFEYNDQPLLGRFDGECIQHGLIDVCNKPYYEFVEQIQQSNLQMYDILCDNIKPTEHTGIFVDRF